MKMMRRARKLLPRLMILLTPLGAIVAPGDVLATNGFTGMASCANCQVPSDFVTAAIAAANNLGAIPGTYTVVSQNYPYSAHVVVTGTPRQICAHGECHYHLVGGAGVAVDAYGATMSSDLPTAQAQMSFIDVGLFGFGRSGPPEVGIVQMSTVYDNSFIGSNDEFDSPGIGNALAQKNINPASFPIGSKIMVQYPDGSKAIFVKVAMAGSYQWTWDGVHAWNSAGQPIDRSGNLISNPNTAGASGGSAQVTMTDAYGNTYGWDFTMSGQCEWLTTITLNGSNYGGFLGVGPC